MSARKKPGRKKTASVPVPKRLSGSAPRGSRYKPETGPLAAAPTLPEIRESRPYRTRYPIAEAEFVRLKERAETARAAKGTATPSVDRPGKQEAALAMMAAPGALAMTAPSATVPPGAAPTPSQTFAGIPSTGWLPPDCTMAAGPEHVVLAVNSTVAIHSKAGGAMVLQRTLTQWFANVATNLTIFDPKVLYDQHAGRWVVLAVAFRTNPNESVFLLSVSATADPIGTWFNHVLDAMKDGSRNTNNWADYPGIGVDSHALYVTANMFAFDGGFRYAKIRVIPKPGPYSGGTVPYFDFVRMKNADGSMAFTIQPCHTFGAPQVEYLVNSSFPNGKALTFWSITQPETAPQLTRFIVNTGSYSLPPNATQKGGAPDLNTGDVRIQHAVFRGDSVWTALTTNRDWGSGNRASIHWFQIRPADRVLVQEGVYGTRASHYSYPAVCPDNNGNMIVVFSRSGSREHGSVAYSGRRATDPLGKLQSSTLLKAGVAHYQQMDGHGRNRWGDYSGVAADPINQRLVWFYGEYASAVNTWATWVGSAFF